MYNSKEKKMTDLKTIFEEYKNIAVYGMSIKPEKAAHNVPAFFLKQGYNIFPINPKYDKIAKQKSYSSLMEVEGNIDILNVFRPSEEAVSIVEEAIERNKSKGDIKLIWFQLGIFNDEAKELAENHGFQFIQDKCIFVEYNNI